MGKASVQQESCHGYSVSRVWRCGPRDRCRIVRRALLYRHRSR
ncbi:protein of unknown function (plasmid) [Cupriavidus taiwanensis]|uniref:Uncharacterized protein n=1 Tax=Cupriavidus taiwanensis TaxID=164546 RepID=A0A375ITH9_9BURK|nr:protein of unknown function [Cupriavidus taiwanensis]